MPAQLNHTIVHAKDRIASARFLSEILGLPKPRPFGPFMVVDTANGVSLDFISADDHEIIVEHYAFLVTEPESARFSGASGHAVSTTGLILRGAPKARSITMTAAAGAYWLDPNGHVLEIITRPYGGS